MKDKLGNHYDNIYSSEKVVFDGVKSSDIVMDVLNYIQSGKVLDIGGGEGRVALFLAKEGFGVEIIDLSKIGLEKAQKKASELNLTIKTKVADITEEEMGSDYDLIVCSFMLHHLSKDKALSLIQKIQENTKKRGFNIITTFTKEGDFYKNDSTTDRFYPGLGEVQDLYKGWDIIKYKEKEGTAHKKNEDGVHMVNVSASILAQKK